MLSEFILVSQANSIPSLRIFPTPNTGYILTASILKYMHCVSNLYMNNFLQAGCILCEGLRPPPKKKGVLVITLNCLWWWYSNSVDLRSVKYPFIAITPRSTLTQTGGSCWALIYWSNRSCWQIICIRVCWIVLERGP